MQAGSCANLRVNSNSEQAQADAAASFRSCSWVQGVEALQEAAEAYLVGLIEDTQVGLVG